LGAKQKLNSAYLLWAFLLAAVAGGSTQSWPVFLVVLGVVVLANVVAGNIRR
jgi:hypothetical protein